MEPYLKYIGRFKAPVRPLTLKEVKRKAQFRRHRIKNGEGGQKVKIAVNVPVKNALRFYRNNPAFLTVTEVY